MVFSQQLKSAYRGRKTRSNLTPFQSSLLEKLRTSEEFIVLPSDKNLGPCILERAVYTQRAFDDHLSDVDTYKQLSAGQANLRINQIHVQIESFIEDFKDSLTDLDRKYIIRSISKPHLQDPFSYFYLLPKIHKTPWKTRPIISACGSITHGIARWVDQQLQPIAKRLPHYLSSSFDLKQKLSKLSLDWSRVRLFTCDAVSMYTNIDTDHALQVISDFLRNHRLCDDIDAEPIICGLELVMRNNVFRFGDTYWLQLMGCAMGTPPACMYATIYFAINELTFYPIFKDIVPYYFRYIDDGQGAWLTHENEATDAANWERFKQAFNYGKLRWTFSERETSVNFLDLTLTVDSNECSNGIHTRIYEKPRNLYLYIPPHSAHQPGILRSMTMGMIKRFYTLCSHQTDFERTVKSFFMRLCKRGYCRNALLPLFKEAIQKSRLNHPRGEEEDNDTRILLHLQYHPCDPPSSVLQTLFRDCLLAPKDINLRGLPLPLLSNMNGNRVKIKRLLVVNHRAPNLKNLLFPRRLREAPDAPASSFTNDIS
jgi:hypothetical protein